MRPHVNHCLFKLREVSISTWCRVRPALFSEQIFPRCREDSLWRVGFCRNAEKRSCQLWKCGNTSVISPPPSERVFFLGYCRLCKVHLDFISHHLDELVLLGFIFYLPQTLSVRLKEVFQSWLFPLDIVLCLLLLWAAAMYPSLLCFSKRKELNCPLHPCAIFCCQKRKLSESSVNGSCNKNWVVSLLRWCSAISRLSLLLHCKEFFARWLNPRLQLNSVNTRAILIYVYMFNLVRRLPGTVYACSVIHFVRIQQCQTLAVRSLVKDVYFIVFRRYISALNAFYSVSECVGSLSVVATLIGKESWKGHFCFSFWWFEARLSIERVLDASWEHTHDQAGFCICGIGCGLHFPVFSYWIINKTRKAATSL